MTPSRYYQCPKCRDNIWDEVTLLAEFAGACPDCGGKMVQVEEPEPEEPEEPTDEELEEAWADMKYHYLKDEGKLR